MSFAFRIEPNDIKTEIKQEPSSGEHEDISDNSQFSEVLTAPNNEGCCKIEPQPGPSGIRNSAKDASPKRNRTMISSDEDSSDDEHHHVRSWRPRSKNPPAIRPKIEPISIAHTDSTNNGIDGRTSHIGMDFLSAPDLQLDWLSDSSDEPNDKGVGHVPMLPSPLPIASDGIKIERRTPIPQVDLTRDTDEEDFIHAPLANISRLARNTYS